MTYRLMVVGSKDWEEDEKVHRELSRVHDAVEHRSITLVTVGVGGHGKGAEAMAVEVAGALGWDVELYPPNWDQFGQSPYLYSVAEIVDTRPDLCLAFGCAWSDLIDSAASMVETVGIMIERFEETNYG